MQSQEICLKSRSKKIRVNIIQTAFGARASHIGSALSCVEILNSVYSTVDLEQIERADRRRDRVILSKGHAALALYSTLQVYGIMSEAQLSEYCKDASIFGGHPTMIPALVEHPTGALGHGANVGTGIAIGLKQLQSKATVYVILGDGELHEGSNWEAFMLASFLGLDNLCFLIDYNKLSGVASSHCTGLDHLKEKLAAFGLNVVDVDGHCEEQICAAIKTINSGRPRAIICHTIKGKGISFMENNNVWHYRPLNSDTYALALNELANGGPTP